MSTVLDSQIRGDRCFKKKNLQTAFTHSPDGWIEAFQMSLLLSGL